jgi:rare lipoprotein A
MFRSKKIVIFFISLSLLFVGCVRVKYFPEAKGDVERGMASWYGPDFHGKPTSNREIYDMFDMTAAHQTLPFGTHVIVTNLNNSKAVTVRINDRGPFVKGRIIDLSYAAAKVLDMVGLGTAPVSIEVLKDMSPKQSVVSYSVQVGSFNNKANAVDLKQKLGNRYGNVVIAEFKTARQIYYRVRIKAKTRSEAETIAGKLSENGYAVIIFEEQ